MSENPATTMRAVAYTEPLPVDDPGSLLDVRLPIPQPGPRDLLVKVEAVAVNPVDYKIRQATDPGGEPKVLGWDAAGTVVAVGEEVRRFKAGDEVFYAGSVDRPGSDAEFQAVDERLVARKPATLSFAQAAALPLTSITAWEGLFEHLGLRDGGVERSGVLLVTAAAGGVGAMVCQLARVLTGLTVIGTASRPETVDFARRMGADHLVDHHKPLPPQIREIAPQGVDFVFSTSRTEKNIPAYAEVLKPFGQIVAIDDPESLPVAALKPKGIGFHWEFMFSRSLFQTPDQDVQGLILGRIARLVDAGAIVSTLTEELSPINAENMRDAHRRLESGTTIGKITLSGF